MIILKFEHNKDLCKSFPFIDMKNLSKHVFKPSGVTNNHPEANGKAVEDSGNKIKALNEFPKRKTFAFLPTVCQNMKVFTKHEVKGINLAHKAQAFMGHLTSRELSQVVSSDIGVNNCHTNPIDVDNATDI